MCAVKGRTAVVWLKHEHKPNLPATVVRRHLRLRSDDGLPSDAEDEYDRLAFGEDKVKQPKMYSCTFPGCHAKLPTRLERDVHEQRHAMALLRSVESSMSLSLAITSLRDGALSYAQSAVRKSKHKHGIYTPPPPSSDVDPPSKRRRRSPPLQSTPLTNH